MNMELGVIFRTPSPWDSLDECGIIGGAHDNVSGLLPSEWSN